MKTFIYHPRSGDRVFETGDLSRLIVIRWENYSRHVLGGTEFAVDAQGRPRNWARRGAAEAVEEYGGLAWDEQGTIHAVVPEAYRSEAWAIWLQGLAPAVREPLSKEAQGWLRREYPQEWSWGNLDDPRNPRWEYRPGYGVGDPIARALHEDKLLVARAYETTWPRPEGEPDVRYRVEIFDVDDPHNPLATCNSVTPVDRVWEGDLGLLLTEMPEKVSGISGWGMVVPELLQKNGTVEESGEEYGCTSETCRHNSHDPAAPTYTWTPAAGVEVFQLGFDRAEDRMGYDVTWYATQVHGCWYLFSLRDENGYHVVLREYDVAEAPEYVRRTFAFLEAGGAP